MLSVGKLPQFFVIVAAVGFSYSIAAENASAPKNRVIRGEVVDCDGDPVVDADIYCSPYVRNRFATVSGRTDIDGKFELSVPPSDEFESAEDRLWAIAPGRRVAVVTLPDSSKNISLLRIVLQSHSEFCVKVSQPNGQPLPNAVVRVCALGLNTERCHVLNGEHFFPPDAFIERTKAITNDHGMAFMPSWNNLEVLRVDITAPSYGRQDCYSRWLAGFQPKTWDITLLPTGKLRGRVIVDGDYATDGLKVHITAMSTEKSKKYHVLEYKNTPPPPPPLFLASEFDVVTDAQGCFEIAEIPHGWLDIDFPNDMNKPHQYRKQAPIDFREGDSKEITLKLSKAVHVHGKFQLVGSDMKYSQFRLGYSKVDIKYGFPFRCEFYVNLDDKGQFEFYSLPGTMLSYLDLRKVPELDQFSGWKWGRPSLKRRSLWGPQYSGMLNRYCQSGQHWVRTDRRKDVALFWGAGQRTEIPSGVASFECPIVKFRHVDGRIIDNKGEPIASVVISSEPFSLFTIKTDRAGKYRLWLKPEQERYHFVINPEDCKLAEKYQSAKLDCTGQDFPNGKIPDIVLEPCHDPLHPENQHVDE